MQQFAGIINPTSVKTTRKQVSVALVIAVSSCMIAAITNTAGNWSENGKKGTIANKTLMHMKLTAMMTMIFHLRVLFAVSLSKIQLLRSANITSVKRVLLSITEKAKGVMFAVCKPMAFLTRPSSTYSNNSVPNLNRLIQLKNAPNFQATSKNN